LALSSVSFAKGFGDSSSSTSSERGFFSLNLLGGYEQSRLLNQDGSYSGFKGYNSGLGLDIRLWTGMGGAELKIFGQTLSSQSKGLDTLSEQLRRSETLYGVKAYINSNLYIALGTGQDSLRFRNIYGEISMTHRFTAVGGGVEANIADGFFLGLGGWYKAGLLNRSENAILSGHSHFESTEGVLYFVWSPSSLTISYSK